MGQGNRRSEGAGKKVPTKADSVTPKTSEIKRKYWREYNHRPEAKRKDKEYLQRPEVKYRRKLVRKKWLSNPIVHERMLKYYRKYKKDWYKKNRLKEIARCSKWNKLNSKRVALNMRLCRKRNPKHFKQYAKKWRNQNRDLVIIWDQNKRAKRLGAIGNSKISKDEWWLLKVMFEGRCAYCWKKKKQTMDHRIPLSRGGKHEINNILPACRSCNSKKHTKTAEEYEKIIEAKK